MDKLNIFNQSNKSKKLIFIFMIMLILVVVLSIFIYGYREKFGISYLFKGDEYTSYTFGDLKMDIPKDFKVIESNKTPGAIDNINDSLLYTSWFVVPNNFNGTADDIPPTPEEKISFAKLYVRNIDKDINLNSSTDIKKLLNLSDGEYPDGTLFSYSITKYQFIGKNLSGNDVYSYQYIVNKSYSDEKKLEPYKEFTGALWINNNKLYILQDESETAGAWGDKTINTIYSKLKYEIPSIALSSEINSLAVQNSISDLSVQSSNYKNDKFKFSLDLPSNLDFVYQTGDKKFEAYLFYDEKFSNDLKNKTNPRLELIEKNADTISFEINKNDFVTDPNFDIKRSMTVLEEDKLISWEDIKTDNGLLIHIYSREITSQGPRGDQNVKEFGATWFKNGTLFTLRSNNSKDIDTIKKIALTFSEIK